jgi:protein disulfide-isomerase
MDGDLPGAQVWGDTFKVSGYPTVLILKPDRTELARMSGGMDLSQYGSLLDNAL